jgi:probable HAF family extracellular repeat protein
MIDLGTLPGYESFGHAINTSGQVTGYLLQNNGGSTQAFLYNGATMIGLGTPSGFSDSNGWGINDGNEVVGDLDRASNETAFLYTGGAIYDLNGLIAPADPLYGRVRFSLAAGINNTGQIAANGCYTSGPLNGECHAFRLDLVLFAGTPGTANCHGQSVSALARQYGGLNAAAAALGFSSVGALQNAILAFCGG